MKKFVTITKQEEKLNSIICDVCEKEFDAEDFLQTQEFLHIDFFGGYGSVFGDGNHIKCDICQECLKKMIGEYCVISEEDDFWEE